MSGWSHFRARLRRDRHSVRRRFHQVDPRANPRATSACARSPRRCARARRAYLNRQYMTIGLVGIWCWRCLIGLFLDGYTAAGFVIARCLAGATGYIAYERPRCAPTVRTAEARAPASMRA